MLFINHSLERLTLYTAGKNTQPRKYSVYEVKHKLFAIVYGWITNKIFILNHIFQHNEDYH